MRYTYILEGLECANCASKIERAINKLNGISSAQLNFLTTKLFVETKEAEMPDIMPQIEKIVKKHEPHINIRKA
jgi:copper chaperone CopZ